MAISTHHPGSKPPYKLTRCPLCGTPVAAILHVTVVKDLNGSWRLKCPRCG